MRTETCGLTNPNRISACMVFLLGYDGYDRYDGSYLKSSHRTISSYHKIGRNSPWLYPFSKSFHRLKAESEGFSVLPVSLVEDIAMGRYGP